MPRSLGATLQRRSSGKASSGTAGDVGYMLVLGLIGGLAAVVGVPLVLLVAVGAGLVAVMVATHLGNVARLGTMLVLLTTFLQPMNGIGPEGIEVGDFALFAAVGVLVVIRLGEGRTLGPKTYRPILIGVLLMALGGTIGAVFGSRVPFLYRANFVTYLNMAGMGQNLKVVPLFLIGSLAPVGMLALCRPDRALLRRIIEVFVAAQVFSVFVGFAVPSTRIANRITGLAIHPGQFGSLGVMCFGATLGLALIQKRIPLWAYFALPIVAIGVVASGSRAALGGLAVLILVSGFATQKRMIFGVLMAGMALVLVVFALGLVKIEGENALARAVDSNNSSATLSAEGRADLVSRTYHRWLERPLTGNGLQMMRPSHNVYVGMLASGGVIGMAGFLTVVSGVLRKWWRRRDDMLVVCVTLGYAGYLVAAFFDNIIGWRWLWFYIALTAATAATVPGPDEAGHAGLIANKARFEARREGRHGLPQAGASPRSTASTP